MSLQETTNRRSETPSKTCGKAEQKRSRPSTSLFWKRPSPRPLIATTGISKDCEWTKAERLLKSYSTPINRFKADRNTSCHCCLSTSPIRDERLILISSITMAPYSTRETAFPNTSTVMQPNYSPPRTNPRCALRTRILTT